MGSRTGSSTERSTGAKAYRPQKKSKPKATRDRNEHRRSLYNSDEQYASKVKRQVRESYRKDNPKSPSKLGSGLLTKGVEREVFVEGLDHPHVVPSYTIPEASAALGKTYITIKKWINDKIIPPPILSDTIKGHVQYSEGELKVIAKIIYEHEQEYEYVHQTHEVTINRIWQTMESYRKSHI